VVSDALWRERLDRNPAVVGESLTLDSVPCTIVGVMASSFRFPHLDPPPQLWMPLAQSQPFQQLLAVRLAPFLNVVGRVGRGYRLSDAQAEMSTIGTGLARAYPASDGDRIVAVTPLQRQIVGDVRPALLMALSAVGLLLLIACANVASLNLARSTGRTREMAIRTALGASRGRLFRQLVVESLLLALSAGAVGLLVAYGGLHAVQAVLLGDLPPIRTVGIDRWVLAFTFTLSVITGVLSGAMPAIVAMRIDPHEHLKAGARTVTQDPKRTRIQRVLVVAEIALALTMLAGAGLLIRSLVRLQEVDPGFRTDHP
jgi:putative ABC transport system permease protein